MPEMPLLDRRGKPFGPIQTWVILSGIMLSPSDQESQLSYQALCQVPPSRLSGNAISKFYKGSIGGSISGEIFICLLQLAIHRDLLPLKRGRRQEPSIAKAVSIVSRELEGQHHDGRLMPS